MNVNEDDVIKDDGNADDIDDGDDDEKTYGLKAKAKLMWRQY